MNAVIYSYILKIQIFTEMRKRYLKSSKKKQTLKV